MDTIFALCSGAGKSGVAIFRISGPSSFFVIQQLTHFDTTKMQPRFMYLRKIFFPGTKEQLDEAMVVYFTAESSFTGEDVVELHVHGSIAVIKILHTVLLKIKGLRTAEPGEFARRAFLHGKFDLTAAEGLADLIEAETELQHKQAIRQLSGGLEKIYKSWRFQLIKLIGFLEAYIDFPDEDISEEVLNDANNLLKNLIKQISEHLNDSNRGERLRNGIKLAILGRTNVGKSTLLNLLMKREVAIVSNIAGTTRDIIEGHLDIAGYPIILHDTAGIRSEDTTDLIEQEGIERAKQISKDADIKIIIFDATKSSNFEDDYFTNLIDKKTILLANKIDLSTISVPLVIKGQKVIPVSIKNKINIEKILEQIEQIAVKIANPTECPQITRVRHRIQLQNALEYLNAFSFDNDLVLATEDIRMAIRQLSSITGKITADEILGEIFSNFCIGK